MKENMPGTNLSPPGYLNRGPAPGEWPDRPQNGYAMTTSAKIAAVIEGGKLNPRRLTLLESKRATKNRKQARGDYREFDSQVGL